MKNQIIASIASIPFALGTLFAGTGTAEAAALIGEFQFAGIGAAEFTQDELNFNPNPSSLFLSPITTTGSFEQFAGTSTTTTIHGPIQFDTLLEPDNTFIDFGGGNRFSLEEASIGEVIQSGQNVSLDIILEGIFESADGDESDGAGNITLQFNDTTASAVSQQLEDGETLTAQFSGALYSKTERVPEPTTTVGLLIVGTLASFVLRQTKQH
ncbi:MAG: PEP-CTERM sorting domain-containing protein [Okeania sp. SIO1H6]|nr:PEP-CTERM sorting domain-containing protein [Okeania sp. SIO1H6]